MKAGEVFVSAVSVCLAFPVMLVIHLAKGFWAGCKYVGNEQRIWWTDVKDDFQ